jgi:dolichol-phosphate mannosyltransferase
MKSKTISVIVACYNEDKNINEIYKRIISVFKNNKSYDYEIIFVDNDSSDNSEKLFNNLAEKNKKVKIIFMSRNFGSPQPSFIAGLEYSKGDAAILLHGDIQDPPELIPKFIEKWKKGYDVVYGIRKTRKGYGFFMNLFYKSFYYLLQKLSYIKIPLNAGDFSLIDRKVINELLKIEEYDYYLRCLRAYVGFKQTGIEYIRDSRKYGKSNENIFTGLWWAKTIIINFSFQPLEFISKIAFLVMFFSFIFIIINIILILIYRNSPPGIPTVVILILFLGGIQLLSLSIIAEYLAKIFLEVKRRPRYIIKKKLNID